MKSKSTKNSSTLQTQQSVHNINDSPKADPTPQKNLESAQFTPGIILQLQRQIGNQAVQRLIATGRNPAMIQRANGDDDGLVELTAGVRGELGVEGTIHKGAKIELPDGTIYKVPVDARCIVHEIVSPRDKKHYWVQIPSDVVKNMNGDDPKKAMSEDLDAENLTDDMPGALKGKVRKSDLSHKGVTSAGTRFKHKKLSKSQPLFARDPQPEDVRQIGLGDCYFLAALSSVARDEPNHIKDMMVDNGDGTVKVRFYQVGVPKNQLGQPEGEPFANTQWVTIRKSIPVLRKSFGMFGAYGGTKHAIWPALMEKAYTIWDGKNPEALNRGGYKHTYHAIAGGYSHDAWEHITGKMGSQSKITKTADNTTENNSQLPDMIPGDDESRDTLMENLQNGTIFLPPWDARMTNGINYNIQEGDTLQGIAQKFGLTVQELEARFESQYGRFRGGDNNLINRKLEEFDKAKRGGTIDPANLNMLRIPDGAVLRQLVPDFPVNEVTTWSNYLNQNMENIRTLIKADRSVVSGEGDSQRSYDTGVTNLRVLDKLGEAAGLSQTAITAFKNYCGHLLEGTPDEPHYSNVALDMFWKIFDGLRNGYVGLGTPDYGGSGGTSGGEDTETVKGIAGGHAYAVVDTFPSAHDKNFTKPVNLSEFTPVGGRYFVKIRNPWGAFGVKYSEDFTRMKWKKPLLGPVGMILGSSEGAETVVELTDIRRFFSEIEFGQHAKDDK